MSFNVPPFQYATRAQMERYAQSDAEKAMIQESRDRELEDYLSRSYTSQAAINAALAAADLALGAELDKQTERMSCSLTNSVGQSITNATSTAVSFDFEHFDVGGLHAGGSPTRITVPISGGGLWWFLYHLLFTANATGSRIGYMNRSGGGSDRLGLSQEYYSTWDTTVSGQWVGRMVDTEYMELITIQNSGGALTLKGDNSAIGALQFAAIRLGD